MIGEGFKGCEKRWSVSKHREEPHEDFSVRPGPEDTDSHSTVLTDNVVFCEGVTGEALEGSNHFQYARDSFPLVSKADHRT